MLCYCDQHPDECQPSKLLGVRVPIVPASQVKQSRSAPALQTMLCQSASRASIKRKQSLYSVPALLSKFVRSGESCRPFRGGAVLVPVLQVVLCHCASRASLFRVFLSHCQPNKACCARVPIMPVFAGCAVSVAAHQIWIVRWCQSFSGHVVLVPALQTVMCQPRRFYCTSLFRVVLT